MSASAVVSEFIASIQAHGIKCVAFDMDCTLVREHSGGCLESKDIQKYVESLSPTVKLLLSALIENGIRIAVATFADEYYLEGKEEVITGCNLVSSVLKHAGFTDKQIADVIMITLNSDLYQKQDDAEAYAFFTSKLKMYGLDTEKDKDFFTYPPPLAKSLHLRIIAKQLNTTPEELLLIDDTAKNVANATKHGSYGVIVMNAEGLEESDLSEVYFPKKK
jgi:hypothetical protein